MAIKVKNQLGQVVSVNWYVWRSCLWEPDHRHPSDMMANLLGVLEEKGILKAADLERILELRFDESLVEPKDGSNPPKPERLSSKQLHALGVIKTTGKYAGIRLNTLKSLAKRKLISLNEGAALTDKGEAAIRNSTY